MTLDDDQRFAAWKCFMTRFSRRFTGQSLGNLEKNDLRAAIDAVDDAFGDDATDVLEANIESDFQACCAVFPEPCKSELKVLQKALMFQTVIDQRKLRDKAVKRLS